MDVNAPIGVIGGSGFYSLLPNVREVALETPYGPPSDSLFLAEHAGRTLAFMPRHGRRHTIPPHRVNYRANIWAMKAAGVRYLITPCAAGGLQPDVHPGDFVVLDQYVDRTRGRIDTFYDGPEVYHVSPADPYCPFLRRIATDVCRDQGIRVHEAGAIVVINGPRFSTRAESAWFTAQGWATVGMTQYPEAYLALEQQMAVVGIALVTDYDCGLHAAGEVEPVSVAEVIEVFERNAARIREVVLEMARRIPLDLDSPHHHALDGARIGG